MCGGEHAQAGELSKSRWDWKESDIPPEWQTIDLPPDHILDHLTDAHCHPTDLDIEPEDYDAVKLGGIGAMATVPEDQSKVAALGEERGWRAGDLSSVKSTRSRRYGPRVVSCFGYHPWFTHRYTLSSVPPSKEDHYRSIFFSPDKQPNERHLAILDSLIPYLPDPLPFEPLLETLRLDIASAVSNGGIAMLGEVGLDGGARMKWPTEGRHLYEEKYPTNEEEQEGDWNRLTPFKVSMAHQKAIAQAQLVVAVDLGVNVSFHSVAAPGPTMDVLRAIRDKHRTRFTNRINVDIHSGGGWSPQFWQQAEKQFLNLYASPSIFITGRSQSAPDLIRAISPHRILVESDSNDVRQTTRLVWAATKWIASCRGWKMEDGHVEWDITDEEEEGEKVGADGKVRLNGEGQEVWAVRTLERNWARFLSLVD